MNTNPLKPLLLATLLALTAPAAFADSEQDLIAVLQSNAGAVEKASACQKLRRIGTSQAVPALAALLGDERLSQSARFALEGLPKPEATAALREALASITGPARIGVVDSLGWRHDRDAVPLLKPLLTNPDTTLASTAATALGRIGDREAVAALTAARESARTAIRPALAEALMNCAERLIADGQTNDARPIYQSLIATTETESIRVAAHAGLIRAAGDGGFALIKSGIEGNDPEALTAALQLAGNFRNPDAINSCIRMLPEAPPARQVALLALLKSAGDTAALPAVAAAVQSPDAAVRIAAMAALGELGDAGTVSLLAKAATSRDAAEQKAARTALASLNRGDVAGALVAHLGVAAPAEQLEVIRALTARSEPSAVPALLQLGRSDQPATRRAALQALGRLIDASQAGALVQLAVDGREPEVLSDIINAFGSLAERFPDGRGLDAAAIARGASRGDLEIRKALLQVCGLFASEPLRGAFRSALQENDVRIRDAAARAMCGTRDAALLPDLLAVARTTSDAGLRSLSIEGIVRLTTDEVSGLSTAQQAGMLASVFDLAKRVEDKRQVLSGLGRVPTQASLDLVNKSVADPEVKAEAEAARLQITRKLKTP